MLGSRLRSGPGYSFTSGRNITLFPRVETIVVMTESITPLNPTRDGVLPHFKIVADLPSPDTKRWVPRRKAVIVDAVRQGVVSLEEVCRRYQLSIEEFITWQRAIESHGVPGLRVTRVQIYGDSRRPPTRRSPRS